MNECGASCTQADFNRIDAQMSKLESAGNLAAIAKVSNLTPEQAANLTQTVVELLPFYGSGESLIQLVTGKSSISGEEASRFWAAVGLVPVAGGMVRKVGEPSVSAIAAVFKGIEKGEIPRTETYFRVEGGGTGAATSKNRIAVNVDGSISINPGCSGQLCVSVGNADHANYYLTNNRPDGSVVVFEVDAALHQKIMDSAIPQRPIPGVPKDPLAPKIVDPNQPGTALELPKIWESLLENNSSNARVLTQSEFFKEFGR
jgi:hypothetical protein